MRGYNNKNEIRPRTLKVLHRYQSNLERVIFTVISPFIYYTSRWKWSVISFLIGHGKINYIYIFKFKKMALLTSSVG